MSIDEIFEELRQFKGKEHEIHSKGWPAGLKERMARLCCIFETSEEEIRHQIILKVTPEISFLFLSFSGVMAIEAVRTRNKDCVKRGLDALAVEDCMSDSRDSTVALAVLYHSAVKIGADANQLFDCGASLASPRGALLFRSFLARSSKNRHLAKFGIKEGITASGEFTYE